MKGKDIRLYEHYLRPGYIFLSRESSVISTVLGSCVAVSLWNSKKKYGGMAHYLYPFASSAKEATAQYGNAAISYFVRMFLEDGSDRRNIEAQIFGGATLQRSPMCERIARENIKIARNVLKRLKIRVVSEDVGGALGRKILYNTFSNETVVYKTKRIRRGDWYPYISYRG